MNTLLLTEAEWRQKAACLEYPAVIFFGLDDNETPAERRAREDRAKSICSGCDVRQECLEYALETKEPYGIWGGLTEIERKAYARGRLS
ncbi:MAG TPA: WhiB family transcriptional regulator [Actinomycetota bacterium]|nr:WhiB family transcriptional regulator [Actinomycetota bacterium]